MSDEKKDPWLPPDLWLVSGIPLIIIGLLAGFVAPLIFNLSFNWLVLLAGILVTASGFIIAVKWVLRDKKNAADGKVNIYGAWSQV